MAKRQTFDEISQTLRNKTVISTMRSFVMRLCHMSITRKVKQEFMSVEGVTLPKTINIRVVLASFMIAYHIKSVFEGEGARETAVQTAARALTEMIQSILDHIVGGGEWRDLDAGVPSKFLVLMTEYMSTFKAWKVPDEQKLVKRIEHALTSLYKVSASFHLFCPETVLLAIRSHQRTLPGRLRRYLSREMATTANCCRRLLRRSTASATSSCRLRE